MRDVRIEQLDQRDWALAPDQSIWSDPAVLLAHMRDNTNHLDSVESIDWSSLCGADARVLDLGCGAGWLTAKLSREPWVREMVAWDGSPQLLRESLPRTIELMDGDAAKVTAVCGEFVPLKLDDSSIDLAVMSSAFHHSDTPVELLDELRRVLAPGAALVLLNETPWPRLAMLSFSVRTAGAALGNLIGRRARFEPRGHLGSDHILYDEHLGDRAMTVPQWRALADRAGWLLELIDTGLPPYRPEYRHRGRLGASLTHFVMRPEPS